MITWSILSYLSHPENQPASPDGWAVWGVVVSTRWWFLVDHCVLRNWGRILVRAVKGLISRAGMVSICPLLWQRDVKLQQTIIGLAWSRYVYYCDKETPNKPENQPMPRSWMWCRGFRIKLFPSSPSILVTWLQRILISASPSIL